MKRVALTILITIFSLSLIIFPTVNVEANSLNTNFEITNCKYIVGNNYSPFFSSYFTVYGSIGRFGNSCEILRAASGTIKPFINGEQPVTIKTCLMGGSVTDFVTIAYEADTFVSVLNQCPTWGGNTSIFTATEVESVTLTPSLQNRYMHLSLCQANSGNWWNIITRYALNDNPNPTDLCAGDPYRSMIEVPRVVDIYS